MLKKFIPKQIVKHFSEINIKQIKEEGYKLVLCDIDNTLVAPDEPNPSMEAVKFINDLLDHGLQVALISNNNEERVYTFNEDLNLPVYPMALKPLSKTYKKIKEDFNGIKSSEIISIGDQLMTDVFGSNKMGIDVILTDRIVEKDLMATKFNRFLENQVIKILKRKGKWPNESM